MHVKQMIAYKSDASWFIGVIFVSSLTNTLVIYCTNCQILLLLLHSGNPHVVHNSPFSGFISGWKTCVSNITFWKNLWHKDTRIEHTHKQVMCVQSSYRAISKWKIWRQCYVESEDSTFVDSLPNELYTKPYCNKTYVHCILKVRWANIACI